MAVRIDRKALSLLYKYFFKREADVRQIPYIPQKTRIIDSKNETRLVRATPESKGINSLSLVHMLSSLESDREVAIHAVSVLADDAVILDARMPGYEENACALTHSMCKTVTALAIGMLVDDGKLSLNQRVYKILEDEMPSVLGKKKNITVYNLLTMSSGTVFNEIGSLTSVDWKRDFSEAPLDFEPGTKFAYNSMNSYILSCIVKRVSGENMSDFLKTRLFDVLGVPDILWERCPDGTERGGWGLYVSTETMLKLGSLFINDGMYGEKRVVSKKWIQLMKRPHMSVANETGGYDYGLHIWVGRENNACLFNGMFGQNILVFPERRIVAVTTASNCEVFQKSRMLDIISDTFTNNDTYIKPTQRQTKVYKKLLKKQKKFGKRHSWIRPMTPLRGVRALIARVNGYSTERLPDICRQLDGKRFTFSSNNSSIFPIFMSFIQNNFGDGLSGISFECEKNEFYITFHEGEESYRVNVGFYRHKKNIISIRQELYTVMAWAEYTEDEDREHLLKIEFAFPEATSVRRMKIYEDGEKLRMRLSELPGYDIVGEYVANMKVIAPKSDPLVNILMPRLENDFISYQIRGHLEPTLYAKADNNETEKREKTRKNSD